MAELAQGITADDSVEPYESPTVEDVRVAVVFALSLVQAQPVTAALPA